jgi:two-component system response regulator
MTYPEKTILYVDDDEDDRELFSEAIKNVYPGINLVFAENGLKAISYLDTVKQPGENMPGLIVLDLNMPYLDGRKTFEKIKTKPGLEKIPVVIFTSSQNPNDKNFFQEAGVELISKPYDFSFMHDIAQRMLEHYV